MSSIERKTSPAGAPAPIQTEATAAITAKLQLASLRKKLERLRPPAAAALLALAFAASAYAANEGGTLLIHFNSNVTYSSDTSNYIGLSGVTCTPDASCPPYEGTCQYGNDTEPTSGKSAGQPDVAFVLASFPPGTCVRLSGVTFGVDYDATHLVLADWGQAGTFELATANWPASGEGTALTFGATPSTSPVTELYWFACYAYAPVTLRLTGHPTQGATFADDAVPSNLESAVGFGVGGLAGARGHRPDDPTAVETMTWGSVKARYRFSTSH